MAATADEPARYEPQWGDYFETVATAGGDGSDGRAAAIWVEQLRTRLGAEADPAASRVTPQALARLVGLIGNSQVNAGAARQVLDRLVAEGGDPSAIVEREGLGSMGGGDRGERGRGGEGQRRQRQGDGPDRRLRDARDQGPRRRRRGPPPDPRAAGRLAEVVAALGVAESGGNGAARAWA